jgi:hypothetical protein
VPHFGAELPPCQQGFTGWVAAGFPVPDQNFGYKPVDAKGKTLKPIPFKELDFDQPWESFDLGTRTHNQGHTEICR